jgi:hypothetical protein
MEPLMVTTKNTFKKRNSQRVFDASLIASDLKCDLMCENITKMKCEYIICKVFVLPLKIIGSSAMKMVKANVGNTPSTIPLKQVELFNIQ